MSHSRISLALSLLLLSILAGCPKTPKLPVPPPVDTTVLSRGPAPATFTEALHGQILLSQAAAKIASLRAELDSRLQIDQTKAATADKSIDLLRWFSLIAFLAVIPAWLVGGIRFATIVFLISVALAALPMIITEAWAIARGPLVIASVSAAILLLAFFVGQLIYQQWIRRATDHQASRLRSRATFQADPVAAKALLAQASVLDHVGTRKYNPETTFLPSVIRVPHAPKEEN